MRMITKIDKKESKLIKSKKVAAYARISVDTDRLNHSFSQQVSYYNNLIQRNPEWLFAGIYADKGITGTKTNDRVQFNKMIEDAMNGKIDIILTKSISRFARNTLDLLNTVRQLKDKGIEVRFEKERINTLTGDGELMLSILASFAQEESRSISDNIKWANKKRFEKGKPYCKCEVYGYKWVGNNLVIVKNEAKIIKFIFKNYANGMNRKEIARQLIDKRTRRGKKFNDATIRYILLNSIYTGDLELQKFYVTDPISKKERRNKGELDKYIVQNHHEGIITRKLYDRVVSKYYEVKEKGKYHYDYINCYPFTGKLRCGECGKVYTRGIRKGKVQDTIFYQCCSSKNPIIENGKKIYKSCGNRLIHEKKLYEILSELNLEPEDIVNIYFYKNFKVKIVLNNGKEIEKEWVRTSYKDWVTKERLATMLERRRQFYAKTNNKNTSHYK